MGSFGEPNLKIRAPGEHYNNEYFYIRTIDIDIGYVFETWWYLAFENIEMFELPFILNAVQLNRVTDFY